MTGRDLIVYILQNHLENVQLLDPSVFVKADEAAVRLGVGVHTVNAWYEIGMLSGIRLGDELYIFVSGPITIHKN